ncbi:lactoylglutathione lyase [Thalassotalea euphylliae]|uniref:lactoylglutathione lyase n=1 Tax=Thalassotalea euphylliae TaxID=1655234 RepID=UPI00363016FD
MDVIDIRTFIPCKDFDVSKSFYTEIGFTPEDASEDLTLFQNGKCFFFLQRFYNEELAKNFMLQVCVADIDAAFDLCEKSAHKTKISPIQRERWGKVFFVWGPVGELLHITELNSELKTK